MKLPGTEKVVEHPHQVPQAPILSVCVQTYNHEPYIRQCLDGIMMQETTFPIEVLVGEDDSSDQTRTICLKYAQRFPNKIRLILHDRSNVIYIDGRPTGRFNFLYNLTHARGKYIALCEGDDYWTDPLKLQKQVDFLENNPDYSICFHSVKVKDEYKNTLIKDYITSDVPETTTILDLAEKGNYIHTPSVVFRNPGSLPAYFNNLPIGDYPLHLLNAEKGKIRKIDQEMAVYRVHNAGYWSTLQSTTKQEKAVVYINNLKTVYSSNETLIKAFNEQLAQLHCHLTKSYLLENNTDEAYRHYSESIRLNSIHIFNQFSRIIMRLQEVDRPKNISWLFNKILKKMFRVLIFKVK